MGDGDLAHEETRLFFRASSPLFNKYFPSNTGVIFKISRPEQTGLIFWSQRWDSPSGRLESKSATGRLFSGFESLIFKELRPRNGQSPLEPAVGLEPTVFALRKHCFAAKLRWQLSFYLVLPEPYQPLGV